MSWNRESFLEKLETQHSFPGIYMFKFIVPVAKKDEVLQILPQGTLSFKESAKNTYISVTLKTNVNSSDEVIQVYEKAHKIEGIVAL